MRAKLEASISLLGLAVVYLVGCSVKSESQHLADRSVIASELLTLPNRKEIEERIYSVSRDEVATDSSRFLFLTRYPYRGTPTTVLYCYEEIAERNNGWLFRGYYPINLWEIYGTNLSCTTDISFSVRSNEVTISCNGFAICTIRSVSEIIRMKGSDSNIDKK